MANLLDQWSTRFQNQPHDRMDATSNTVNANFNQERSTMANSTIRAGLQALVSMRADRPGNSQQRRHR
jgi:hypothetical protein